MSDHAFRARFWRAMFGMWAGIALAVITQVIAHG